VHPRLARLLIEGTTRGVFNEACRVAALLSSGDRLSSLDAELSYAGRNIEKQLRRATRAGARPDSGTDADLRIALLSAYPDRVARRKSESIAQLGSGRCVSMAGKHTPEFFVAIDVEDRRDGNPPSVRLGCPIEPDWLIDVFGDRVREEVRLIWNREAERVESMSAILYDQLAMDETRGRAQDDGAAAEMLARQALAAGLERFVDSDELTEFLARVEFATKHSGLQRLSAEDVSRVLGELCFGLRSFAELRAAARDGLFPALKALLGTNGERALNELAPERIRLKNRQVKVHYVSGQQPWIESRLQDFFGLAETPRIAAGQAPLLVHLLAPNGRPVQVTSDLAGFWERLYPQVRRELGRRYPKHSWPENPTRAIP
ncbi:MAG TPA: ATP-dependent helicase C-terminal domain-containing protein, partial [Bryobacteraceae bacterium]|nr:ATP-dependent helicase C-terminal domain-containing protein [Bryobacteraceae bacterium]